MKFALKPLHSVFRDKEHGWGPFVWLVYLGFFFIQPVMDHFNAKQWTVDLLGAAVFVVLYLGIFLLEKPIPLVHIGGMVLLGMAYIPYNGGASAFFIFAGAFVPFLVDTQKRAVGSLLAIVTIGAVEGWLLHLNGWSIFYSAVFPLMVGGSNIFFAERNRMNRQLRKANDEIEHLAKVAERERIARDLHDVLGHTLSVIILKSELAGKLITRDLARAEKEIHEVEDISRKALSDVRDAIRGYRSRGLTAELAQAKATLETAGVAVQCEATTALKLPAIQESVLSLAVREAVTNVVRHAQARSCRVSLEQQNGSCRLEIHDDGRGGFAGEGDGLRGMRERVEMLGGTMLRETETGTTLTITLPLSSKTAAEPRNC
jgi:two-component system sensor histidine kinase DesK